MQAKCLHSSLTTYCKRFLRKRKHMTKETIQTQQLSHEKSLTPLLREAADLLATYISGEETRDLEPIISAQALLANALDLLLSTSQAAGIAWARQFPVVCINRADL